MHSAGGKVPIPVSDGQINNTPKTRKPYNAPKFKVLTHDQAAAELKSKGLPGDEEVQKLLGLAEPDVEKMEHRPSLLVELKLPVRGESTLPELKVTAEFLNHQHLSLLRKYLQISEEIMGGAGDLK